jgi:hypothetical protein
MRSSIESSLAHVSNGLSALDARAAAADEAQGAATAALAAKVCVQLYTTDCIHPHAYMLLCTPVYSFPLGVPDSIGCHNHK